MSESIVSTPSQSTDTENLGKMLFHIMKVNVTGTISYTGGVQSVGTPHEIGFKPSFWLLAYSSSYGGNSTLQILEYDTANHEFHYQGGQTSGLDCYVALSGTKAYFKASYWGINNTGTYSVSQQCEAVFFK